MYHPFQFTNQTNTMAIKTLGEMIVRTDFNASNSTAVSMLKNDHAKLIDNVNAITPTMPEGGSLTPEGETELHRLKQAAIHALEMACMYAVKAATL